MPVEIKKYPQGMTIRDLKAALKDWPEEDKDCEAKEVWVETQAGGSCQVTAIWPLNKGGGSADLLLV